MPHNAIKPSRQAIIGRPGSNARLGLALDSRLSTLDISITNPSPARLNLSSPSALPEKSPSSARPRAGCRGGFVLGSVRGYWFGPVTGFAAGPCPIGTAELASVARWSAAVVVVVAAV